MGWAREAPGLAGLDAATLARLDALAPARVPAGTALFHPGDAVKGYVIALSGRVDVCLTGPTGREMLLYSVEPGQSCIQSTLGLLGGTDYSAEAIAATESRFVLLPKALFLDLIDNSASFRRLVFRAFANRMQNMMQIIEKVSFQRVECRLAAHLLSRADDDGRVHATQVELATAVGSAREVISRRLEAWSQRGWVETGRGEVRIADADALTRLAEEQM